MEPLDVDLGAAYSKNNGYTFIKVTVNEFRNQEYVHIREYGVDLDTYYKYPTPKGIAILGEYLDEIINKLNTASEILAVKNRRNVNVDQLSFDFMGE